MEKMPVFIKVEQYEDVLDLLSLIKQRMDAAKNTLVRVNELKKEEDEKIRIWEDTLKEIEDKLAVIDSHLVEP